MKRPLFLIVLTILAAAGLYFFIFHRPPAEVSGPIPSLILSAPKDARYLIYVDVAALRQSKFISQLIAKSKPPALDPEFAEFERATGFDYARDLDHVVIAIRNIASVQSALALAEGRFDRAKIEAFAARQGKLETVNGLEVFSFPTNRPAKSMAILFQPNSEGSPQRVSVSEGVSLDSLAPLNLPGLSSAGTDDNLRKRVSHAAGAALFAIAPADTLALDLNPRGPAPREMNQLFRDIRWLIVTARPEGDHLRVSIEGECDGIGSALKLSTSLSAYRMLLSGAMKADVGTSKEGAAQRALIEAILQHGEILRDGNLVQYRFELGPEIIPALLNN